MKLALTIAVLLAMPVAAQGKPLECVLWPKTCQVPAPVPASPEPPPVQAAPVQPPKVEAVRPAKRVPFKFAKAKAKKKAPHKPKPAKPKLVKKHPAKVVDQGPDLPWPCWQVRLGALGKTQAQLEQEGRDRGVNLSPKQIRQAKACLGRT